MGAEQCDCAAGMTNMHATCCDAHAAPSAQHSLSAPRHRATRPTSASDARAHLQVWLRLCICSLCFLSEVLTSTRGTQALQHSDAAPTSPPSLKISLALDSYSIPAPPSLSPAPTDRFRVSRLLPHRPADHGALLTESMRLSEPSARASLKHNLLLEPHLEADDDRLSTSPTSVARMPQPGTQQARGEPTTAIMREKSASSLMQEALDTLNELSRAVKTTADGAEPENEAQEENEEDVTYPVSSPMSTPSPPPTVF